MAINGAISDVNSFIQKCERRLSAIDSHVKLVSVDHISSSVICSKYFFNPHRITIMQLYPDQFIADVIHNLTGSVVNTLCIIFRNTLCSKLNPSCR
jgi:hypothetical protein